MSQSLVREWMRRPVPTARPGDTLAELYQLMESKGVRHVPVVDGSERLVGLVCQGDLLHSAVGALADLPVCHHRDPLEGLRVAQIMTTAVKTIEPNRTIEEAARIMFESGYGCLPVVHLNRLLGLLTAASLLRVVAAMEAHPALTSPG